MLEGPAGIGSGPVLPRDQTLVCSFNVLILSVVQNLFFFHFLFLYLFFLFSSPEYCKLMVVECDRSAAVNPLVTRCARAAQHGVHAARAARGEALVGAGVTCLCAA